MMASSRGRKSFTPPGYADECKQRYGESLAEHLGVLVTEVRLANYRFHTGTNWTMTEGWERLVNGEWVKVGEFEMPQNWHSSHSQR